jgi:DNA repair photolyase
MKISVCSHRPILEPCALDNIDFQVDSYVGCEHFCYYCYALKHAETNWKEEIRIHRNISEQLCEELEKISPQTIYMGYRTDPYQPCEVDYRQTREVLKLLVEKGFSASILTKSDLFLRDVDLLQRMESARISISTAFTDESVRQLFESKTKDTEARIEALRCMKEAGLQTSALICPIIPYVTDAIALVEKLAPITDTIWIYGLSIENREGPNWKYIQDILVKHFPGEYEQIESVIFDKAHSYWTNLRQELQHIMLDQGLCLKIHI